MSWCHDTILCFDTETTGADPETARIVTVDLVVIDPDSGNVDANGFLVNPGVEIPAEAIDVHGITNDMARELGADPKDILPEVANQFRRAWKRGYPVVAFNAAYDLTVLDRECRRHLGEPFEVKGPVLDPYVIDRALDPYRKGKRKLGVTCEYYGVTLDHAHNSAADAEAAGWLLLKMADKYPELAQADLRSLWTRQRQWHRAWAAGFEEYLRKQGKNESVSGHWPMRPFLEES